MTSLSCLSQIHIPYPECTQLPFWNLKVPLNLLKIHEITHSITKN